MEFTDNELWLMLSVLEAHSAHVKLQASVGKYNKEKAKHITGKMCELSKKLYAEEIRRAETRT